MTQRRHGSFNRRDVLKMSAAGAGAGGGPIDGVLRARSVVFQETASSGG